MSNRVQDIAYQWRLDGVNVEGATQSSLILRDLKMSDAGVYTFAFPTLRERQQVTKRVQVLMPVAINNQRRISRL